jgi:hypothetical protein
MTPSAAGSLALQSKAGVRAAVPIRPVARDGGRVELAPRRDAVDAPPPDPIRAGRRALASPQAPFISHPSASRENAPPMRVAPGAVTAPMARPVPPARGREDAPAQPVMAAPPARPAPVAVAAPRSVEQARPVPGVEPLVQQQPPPERRAVSRAPRRVAPSGPDPLATRGGDKKDEKGEKK